MEGANGLLALAQFTVQTFKDTLTFEWTTVTYQRQVEEWLAQLLEFILYPSPQERMRGRQTQLISGPERSAPPSYWEETLGAVGWPLASENLRGKKGRVEITYRRHHEWVVVLWIYHTDTKLDSSFKYTLFIKDFYNILIFQHLLT